jgi:hypothetical protein
LINKRVNWRLVVVFTAGQLRTGVTPEGKRFEIQFMPYVILKDLPENDLRALYNYLRSLAPIYK